MAREPGSTLATLEDAEKRGDLNVLRPVISIDGRPDAQSPYLVETVQVIQIVPEVDTYHDFRYANAKDGKHALSGLGLAKIAAAAGVKWVPEECRVEERTRDRQTGHVYIRYRAAGAIRQPNGEWHLEIATKEIDTADEQERLLDNYTARAKSARGDYRGPKTPEAIEAAVRRDILQIREFVLGLAETKAKNRVIRRILALRQVYTAKELARPFAVPRLVYRPEVAEENLRLESHRAAALGAGEETISASVDAEDGSPAPGLPSAADSSAPETTQAPAEETARVADTPPAPASENVGGGTTDTTPTVPASPAEDDAATSPDPAPLVEGTVEDSFVEPTESETWRPPEQTSLAGPDRPKVDPSDATTGRKFSELVVDETGLERLRVMTQSKAPARAEAARAWLAYAEERSR